MRVDIRWTIRLLLGMFVTAAVLVAARPIHAQPPCCTITELDQRTGTVTAKDTATGRQFTFRVTDAKSLSSLKAGQGVYANFTTKQVSLNGSQACCAIISVQSAPALNQARTFRGLAIPFGAVPVAGLKGLPTQPDLTPYLQEGVTVCQCAPTNNCPPSTDTPFGVKNISPLPASAAITLTLSKLSGGGPVRSWSLTGLAGNGQQIVGKFHRVADLCNNPVTEFPNYALTVEYPGAEAQTNNNTVNVLIDSNTTIQ